MGNRSNNQVCSQNRLLKLYLTEKLFDNKQLLNKKSELVNTLRHKNNLLLKSLKRNRSRNDTMDSLFF